MHTLRRYNVVGNPYSAKLVSGRVKNIEFLLTAIKLSPQPSEAAEYCSNRKFHLGDNSAPESETIQQYAEVLKVNIPFRKDFAQRFATGKNCGLKGNAKYCHLQPIYIPLPLLVSSLLIDSTP